MVCVQTEQRSLRSAEDRVRRDMSRFEFSSREWAVMNVLLLESLNRERERIFVNDLKDLVRRVCWGTGLRWDHCMKTVKALFEARVLAWGADLNRPGGQFCVIDGDPNRWKIAERDRKQSAPMELGVDGELFPEPSLAAEVAIISLQGRAGLANDRAGELPAGCYEGSGPQQCAVLPQVGENKALPKSGRLVHGPLPELGTDRNGLADEAVPQIGEDSTKPLKNAGEMVVLPKSGKSTEDAFPKLGSFPDSGIFPELGSTVVQRLNVSSKEDVHNVVTLPVPKLGSRSLPVSGRCVPHGPPRDEGLLIGRVRKFVGEEDWGYYGGAWVTHGVRGNYEALERSLNDCEQTVREGRIRIRHRGKYLWKIFALFGGRKGR